MIIFESNFVIIFNKKIVFILNIDNAFEVLYYN
jgi:hypothetical protein